MNPDALIPKLLGLGLAGVACFGLFWMLAAAPAPRPVRLGVRGFRRQRALTRSALWACVEPLVRWLGARLQGAVPRAWLDRLSGMLFRCGEPLGLSAPELAALTLASFGIGLGAALAIGPAVGMGSSLAWFVAPQAAAFPTLAVSQAGAARLVRIRRSWPHLLELLALAVGAGSDLVGALHQITDRCVDPEDDLVVELGYLLRQLQLGFTRKQALLELGERVPLEGVREFVSAVIQAEERGTPLQEVLRTQAVGARVRRTVRGEEAASRAGVKMVVPLFLVFICILLLVLGPPLLSLSGQAPGGPGW